MLSLKLIFKLAMNIDSIALIFVLFFLKNVNEIKLLQIGFGM